MSFQPKRLVISVRDCRIGAPRRSDEELIGVSLNGQLVQRLPGEPLLGLFLRAEHLHGTPGDLHLHTSER